ncbi:MAG: transcription termination/antitermination protein NusA, partial [bacterium]
MTVSEEDLSKAIGRKGQNARLSSRLMGWDVQVRKDETKEEQFKEKIGGVAHTLGEQLRNSDEVAAKLTLFGGVSAEMIVDMPVEFLTSSLELSTEEAEAILERARSIASG